MKPPSHLNIKGKPWKVRIVSRDKIGGALGECNYAESRLSVATKQSPFDTRDTLLHESLHAMLHGVQWEKTVEEEEKYVLDLATGLTSLLRDNPELVRWLVEPP